MRARRILAFSAAVSAWMVITAAPAAADTCILEEWFESDALVGVAVGVTVKPVPGTGQVDGVMDFGNGTVVPVSAGGPSAIVVYEQPGVYTVTFTGQGVTDGQSCSDAAKPVGIYTAHELVAAFVAAADDETLLVTFDASASRGPIDAYVWDFGDGSYGEGVSVQHRYATAGSYQVTLGVLALLGADQATDLVTVGAVSMLDLDNAAALAEEPAAEAPAELLDDIEEEDEGWSIQEQLLLLAALVAGLGAALREFYESEGRESITDVLDLAADVTATVGALLAAVAVAGLVPGLNALTAVAPFAVLALSIAGLAGTTSAGIKALTGVGGSALEAAGAYAAAELAESLGDPELAAQYRAQFDAASDRIQSGEYSHDLQQLVLVAAGGGFTRAWQATWKVPAAVKRFAPELRSTPESADLAGAGLGWLLDLVIETAGTAGDGHADPQQGD